MRVLVDENLPFAIVELARAQEIEAVWVRDAMPAAPDVEILKRLRSTGETLVTRDIRFANHVLEQMAAGSRLGGVVLIREQRMTDIRQAWRNFLKAPRAPRGIAVLTSGSIRFREHPGSAGES